MTKTFGDISRLVAFWALVLLAVLPLAAQDSIPAAQRSVRGDRRHRPAVTIPGGDTTGVVKVETLPSLSDRLSHSLERDTVVFSPVTNRDRVTVVAPPVADSAAVAKKLKPFNPNPTRALWLSALCPGLGQIYNRRYWKLPIIVGAYVGLGYATAWNNRMLGDYTKAYRDAMDADPTTRSYMNFYPPTVDESSIDMEWLKKALKNKKDYYRRYRDICIIGMVAVYALSIIDAYVDASLAHFDISPDLSLRVHPEVNIGTSDSPVPTNVGVGCSLRF